MDIDAENYTRTIGWMFDPSDEDLCDYYLKMNNLGEKLDHDLIKHCDVFRIEPWKLLGEDSVFEDHEKRGVGNGQWRTVEKGLNVEEIGKKNILVFWEVNDNHFTNTNWVMRDPCITTKENPALLFTAYIKSKDEVETSKAVN